MPSLCGGVQASEAVDGLLLISRSNLELLTVSRPRGQHPARGEEHLHHRPEILAQRHIIDDCPEMSVPSVPTNATTLDDLLGCDSVDAIDQTSSSSRLCTDVDLRSDDGEIAELAHFEALPETPELHMLPPATEFPARVPSEEDFDADDFWAGAWCGGCTREQRRQRRRRDMPDPPQASPTRPPPFIQLAEARKTIAVNKASDAPCDSPDDDLEFAAAPAARTEASTKTMKNVSANACTKVAL